MIFLCCLERNKTWKSKQRSEKGIAHRPKRSEKQHTKQWKKELYSALMTSWTKKASNMKAAFSLVLMFEVVFESSEIF